MKAEVSELVDGELDDPTAERVLDRVRLDDELRSTWETYHLIGDVLRGAGTATGADLAERIRTQLANEPTILAPKRMAGMVGRGRWYALSAAASVLGVSLVAWVALPQRQSVIEAAATSIAPISQVQTLIQAPSVAVDDYILAHQGVSPSAALQGFATYVRTVSDVRDEGQR